MPAPYSNDLRTRVIKAIQTGKQTYAEIAQRFDVSKYFVSSLWHHYQKTGSVEPKKMGGHVKPKVDAVGEDHLREWLANESSLTLDQLCERYDDHFGVKMGKSSMDRALRRAKITVKKKVLMILEKTHLEFKSLQKTTVMKSKTFPKSASFFSMKWVLI